jgi:hypothetical protein
MAAAMVAEMTTVGDFVVHTEPVWRERSDFIITAALQEADRPKRFEQLFAKRVGDDRFEICCIPFFLFDVALGDIVATSPAEGRKYVLEAVVEPSGRFVFRVWFGESFHSCEAVAEALNGLGALLEWSSANLLAVDAADSSHAQVIADYLAVQERAGRLMYETGRS